MRSSVARKSSAATAMIRGDTDVGMAATGVAAAMVKVAVVVTVGVATPTTAAEGTAAAEAEEARLGQVVARDTVQGLSDEVAGAVAAALAEVAVDDGTAREVVRRDTVLPPLPARPQLRVRTAARSLW